MGHIFCADVDFGAAIFAVVADRRISDFSSAANLDDSINEQVSSFVGVSACPVGTPHL
jgi:hypothetical protein